MMIPSALTLLVNVFPDPHQQARAIGLFGGCGGVANSAYPRILLFVTGSDEPHGSFSFGYPNWCNVRRMGVVSLGILVCGHYGCAGGSSLFFHHTAANRKD